MAVPSDQRLSLMEMALAAGDKLEGASPVKILLWAVRTFGNGLCASASMADALLIDMLSRLQPGAHIIFLDTGYHFAETLDTAAKIQDRYPITLHTVAPKQSVLEQDALFGPELHDRDPDACCNLRKIEPLRRSLEPFLAWASGIRRDETANRRGIRVVDWDDNRSVVKVNPFAAWTDDDVLRYTLAHDVIVNPLIYAGYPSIGCEPCTQRVEDGADPRSGRWAGSAKTECGLHMDSRTATPVEIMLGRPATEESGPATATA